MSVTPHTSAERGKRVIITLKDGRRFVDKFIERKVKGLILLNYGFIRGREIRAVTIYRGQVL